MDWVMFCYLAFIAIVMLWAIPSARKNGYVDGYGFARDPSCPGYWKAGKYIKKSMDHIHRDIPEPWKNEDESHG